MPDTHPSPDLLERFMRNDTEAAENREIVRHLMTGCPECLKTTRAFWVLGEGEAQALRQKLALPRTRRRHPPAEDGRDVFEDIARRTLEQARALVAGRHDARRLVEELEALAPAERLARGVAERRWLTPLACEALLERVRQELETRSATALSWAEPAVALAERLDPGVWGRDGVTVSRCHAWGALGEARRQAHDLEGADRALAAAEGLLEAGADDRLGAEVSYFKARLRIDQNRFDEAGRLLETVVAVYRRAGEQRLLCRALILEGALRNWTGNDGEALVKLRESLSLLDRRAEPRLCAEAFYRLVPLLKDPDEALAALRESQVLYEQVGDHLNLARLRRLEGKVEELRGDFAAAETHLNEARKGLLSEGRGREAAQASLDLALLYARQGKALDTHQIARWTFPVFSAKSVQRETILALLVLQWEAESHRINPGFIDEIARYLDPAPRPSPSGLSSVH